MAKGAETIRWAPPVLAVLAQENGTPHRAPVQPSPPEGRRPAHRSPIRPQPPAALFPPAAASGVTQVVTKDAKETHMTEGTLVGLPDMAKDRMGTQQPLETLA